MTLDDKNNFLKSLNEKQFLNLGGKHIAYMKAMEDGRLVVHNASGELLAVAADTDEAIQAMVSRDMKPVPLH
jgi:hypothetical protein